MARDIKPTGADGNAYSWVQTQLFDREERPFIIARLSRAENTELRRSNRVRLERDLGKRRVDKMVKARYDWLFDDLQRFTSIDAESIETKEDLRAFLEDTIGKSPAFQSMQRKAPRNYESSMRRAVENFWGVGKVDQVARTNVVEIVNTEKAKAFGFSFKDESKRQMLVEASKKNKLKLIRRDMLVLEAKDKRGRTYHYDVRTGRRAKNPENLLRELGFRV